MPINVNKFTLPYFYEPSVSPVTPFTLSEETSKHCIQVLRIKTGEHINLTDGKGSLYKAAITKEDKKHCEAAIEEYVYSKQNVRQVSVAISLLKNANRFEWFLEKATETGVAEIIPLLCERTERQNFRYGRMNAVLIAAMLQSRQCWLPLLQQPFTFKDVVSNTMHTQKLMAHCGEGDKIKLTEVSVQDNVQILIGPEGDFSPAEIQAAISNDYIAVALGSTRLRTETAGVVASALLINMPP